MSSLAQFKVKFRSDHEDSQKIDEIVDYSKEPSIDPARSRITVIRRDFCLQTNRGCSLRLSQPRELVARFSHTIQDSDENKSSYNN